MKPASPLAPSTKFARYATASAVALGAAAVAEAQTSNFAGTYLLTPNVGNTYGVWTATAITSANGTSLVDTSGAPSELDLTLTAATGAGGSPETLDFLTTAQAAGIVSFTVSNFTSGLAPSPSFYFTPDGTNFYNFTGISSYTLSFSVTNGATFGFRLTIGYSGSSGSSAVQITNFSAPIPEPGAAGLLMGCATAGFIALVGVRRSRQRAA